MSAVAGVQCKVFERRAADAVHGCFHTRRALWWVIKRNITYTIAAEKWFAKICACAFMPLPDKCTLSVRRELRAGAK